MDKSPQDGASEIRDGSGIFMIRQFLRDPRIASVKSTSPYFVRRLCGRLDLRGRRVVVEFGPGLGCFSRALLKRLSPDSVLVLIESNREFASALREVREPRLRVVCESAVNVKAVLHRLGLPRADAILSGIPFSHYPEAPKMRLLGDVRDVLGEDGVFLAYQASARLEKDLKRVFTRVRVQRDFCHIPPLVVLEARCA